MDNLIHSREEGNLIHSGEEDNSIHSEASGKDGIAALSMWVKAFVDSLGDRLEALRGDMVKTSDDFRELKGVVARIESRQEDIQSQIKIHSDEFKILHKEFSRGESRTDDLESWRTSMTTKVDALNAKIDVMGLGIAELPQLIRERRFLGRVSERAFIVCVSALTLMGVSWMLSILVGHHIDLSR